MAKKDVDLANVFRSVTQSLAENQQALNQADEYNQDHGDNMVQTFQTITSALEQKKGRLSSAALAFAAQQLSENSTSSSGKLYAENLAQAATQMKGKKVDAQGALQLLQTLIGGGQAQQPAQQPAQQTGGGDLLGTLLGGLTGGGEPSQQQTQQTGGGDLLGTLLSGLTGGEEPAQQQAPQQGGGGLLGSLLSGLTGGGEPVQQQAPQQGSGDLLGALLGGLTGGGSSTTSGGSSSTSGQSGLNLTNLLSGALAYVQAKQSGKGNLQAIVQAFMAYSGMGNAAHRTQSTELVVNSFLQALGTSGG